MTKDSIFSNSILYWHQHIKLPKLPWQLNKTIYNIWISEIMLQQTQVPTVIPYYNKFIQKFPIIYQLAKAELNEILYIWSGLGYYKRAIHLHQTSKIIVKYHNGQIPNDFDTLLSLPGIGRSTAGAILSLALNKKYPILDGNIKRILIRYYDLNYNQNLKKNQNYLWNLIEKLMPSSNIQIAYFNQAMMNLGRLICTYHHPKCDYCPINNRCQFFLKKHIINQQKKMNKIIQKNQKKIKMIWWLILSIKQYNIVLLIKRSIETIWHGLFCFPEFHNLDNLNKFLLKYNIKNNSTKKMEIIKCQAGNTIFEIQPIFIDINEIILFNKNYEIWYNLNQPAIIGLPAPVIIILKKIKILLNQK